MGVAHFSICVIPNIFNRESIFLVLDGFRLKSDHTVFMVVMLSPFECAQDKHGLVGLVTDPSTPPGFAQDDKVLVA